MNKKTKLNQQESELLNLLLEESSEVIQAVSKTFRFGWDSCHPDKPNFSNKEHLEEEVGDLLCIIKLMVSKGIIDFDNVERCAHYKLDKLRKFSTVKVD